MRSAVVTFALVLLFSGCSFLERTRTPNKYLIPSGFEGWIYIYYDSPDGIIPPRLDGYNFMKIPPSGVLRVSTSLEEGAAADLFFYYKDETLVPLRGTITGKGGMIWGGGVTVESEPLSKKPSATYYRIFVGTEEKYRNAIYKK